MKKEIENSEVVITGSRKKKKKSKLVTGILVVLMMFGTVLISYPVFSNWWNERHATKAIASYVEEVEKIDTTTREEMIKKAVAYNATLKSLHFMLTDEEYKEYESILDVSGTGIMGYIQIPTIKVNLPIYHGTDESILSIATGHIAGSAFPVGGKGTHAVISGHRGLPSAKLFSDLDLLKEGDIFIISVIDRTLTYEIDQIHIVLPDEISDLAIDSQKDYVTLVTCTPYGVNSHRMLIRGHRIDNLEDVSELVVTGEASKVNPTVVMLVAIVPLIMLALIISRFIPRRKHDALEEKRILDELEKAVTMEGDKDEK